MRNNKEIYLVLFYNIGIIINHFVFLIFSITFIISNVSLKSLTSVLYFLSIFFSITICFVLLISFILYKKLNDSDITVTFKKIVNTTIKKYMIVIVSLIIHIILTLIPILHTSIIIYTQAYKIFLFIMTFIYGVSGLFAALLSFIDEFKAYEMFRDLKPLPKFYNLAAFSVSVWMFFAVGIHHIYNKNILGSSLSMSIFSMIITILFVFSYRYLFRRSFCEVSEDPDKFLSDALKVVNKVREEPKKY